ncbi:YveK family protein [Paenibacillus sp. R14(2021)]|uniref:YveK family protein n=1 Tax=Paenibacillus sp. R14(2021) TaxID=2859228 RepID=UPI001C61573D|nr:lipopolysaccharide biosynthesis protein [Paenibacillus sp. R14(2021)]
MSTLLVYLLKRIWIIILAVAVCVGPVIYWSNSKPVEYKASASAYILRQTTSTSTNLYQELLAALSLIKDYKVLIPSTAVTASVQEALAAQYEWGKALTAEKLASQVRIENGNESHIIAINVTDKDPEKAAIIANAVLDAFKQFSKKITIDDSVIEIEAAQPPKAPTSSNKLYIGAAGLAGLVLGFLIALLPVMLGIDSSRRRRRTAA